MPSIRPTSRASCSLLKENLRSSFFHFCLCTISAPPPTPAPLSLPGPLFCLLAAYTCNLQLFVSSTHMNPGQFVFGHLRLCSPKCTQMSSGSPPDTQNLGSIEILSPLTARFLSFFDTHSLYSFPPSAFFDIQPCEVSVLLLALQHRRPSLLSQISRASTVLRPEVCSRTPEHLPRSQSKTSLRTD